MHWTTLDKGRTYDNDVMKCCFSVDQIEVIGASTSMAPLVSTWAKKNGRTARMAASQPFFLASTYLEGSRGLHNVVPQ